MRKLPISLTVCLFIVCWTIHTTYAAQPTLEVYNPAGVRPDGVYVDKLLKKTMTELGKSKPPLAGNFPEARIEKIPIKKDAFAEINDLFYKRGWTDGLPIVPPAKERVEEMLKGADLSPDFSISILDPMGGLATGRRVYSSLVGLALKPLARKLGCL